MAMPMRRRLLLATPLPAAWMSSVIIHNVYVKFYTDIVGLSSEYVGWVYFWFNVWNVLNDPVFGVLLDKLKYRPGKGKFLRVMRITIPFMLVGLALMAWTPSSWSQTAIFAVFLLELFLFDVACTFYLISATSYLYLAAPTREERIDVEVARTWIGNIFSTVATVVATQLLVGGAVTERMTMNVLLMLVVLVNGALYAFAAWKLKDPPELYALGDGGDGAVDRAQLWRDLRSIFRMPAFWAWFFYGLTSMAPMGIYFTAFLYLMDHVIGAKGWQATAADVGSMVVVLVALPLYAAMIKRIGSRTSLWLGSVPYLLGMLVIWQWADQWGHVLLAYILIMSGKHIVGTAGVALEAALIDDNERATGVRKAGTIAAVKALLGAPLTGAQMVIFMGIISAGGYVEQAREQSDAAKEAIRFAAGGVPIIFCVIGFLPLLFLPYSKRVEAELTRWSKSRRSGEVPEPDPAATGDDQQR